MANADDKGRWIWQKTLGAGAFGVVELWCNDYTGNTIAVKKCKGGPSQLTEKQKQRWILEVEKMNSLNHPNIVSTRRVPTQLLYMGKEVPVLCMEYCSRGDLRTVLNKSENCCGVEETEALKIMQHVSSAVEYLHSRKLAHRDLKPENIVLQRTKEKTIYKLTDFGYVRELGEMSVDASVVGTCNYLAPELLWKPTYTSSADYWSLGILFYEVITGNRPLLPNIPMTMEWMKYISKKKYEDICARGGLGDVTFSSEIESPSTISDSMRHHLTPWFRVALQWDPRRRGKLPEGPENRDEVVIFSLLSRILRFKIVYVFVAPLYKIDSYAVYPNISVREMQKLIQEKTGIESVNQKLTNRLGYAISQADAPLFGCIEEPHLVVFQRDKFHVENPPKPNMSPSVQHMIHRTCSKDTFDYETTRRYYAAALFFIKQQLDLFKLYIIALSIKIDMSNASLVSLRERAQTLMSSANFLMNQLNLEAQSSEHGLMSDYLKEDFDTTTAKTQKLVESALEVVTKLDVLSADLERLKVFSDTNWLEDWTRLYAEATKTYETCLTRNRGQRDSNTAMVRLLYQALKLHGEQLKSPTIEAVVRDVTRLDTNILQLQQYLDSFEALVQLYKENFNDVLTRRSAELPTTCRTLSENDTMMLDNIVLSQLIDAFGCFSGQVIDFGDLNF